MISLSARLHPCTQLYHKLLGHGLTVFWDQACLKGGQEWECGFVHGLFSAQVFVPLLSRAALAPFAQLHTGSSADNVLLEQVSRR